ncbi:hypothetical protein QAD02_023178 [Eretmocerus hayati]|uniref:Uncharacterized protein n=1 Tax=Eretmocerus hayati TaxID=131215 RepID=A0ACC2PUX1_9HYME|nr:hypothetical protein QAD02_023178 [Eretmocerus hayati]
MRDRGKLVRKRETGENPGATREKGRIREEQRKWETGENGREEEMGDRRKSREIKRYRRKIRGNFKNKRESRKDRRRWEIGKDPEKLEYWETGGIRGEAGRTWRFRRAMRDGRKSRKNGRKGETGVYLGGSGETGDKGRYRRQREIGENPGARDEFSDETWGNSGRAGEN